MATGFMQRFKGKIAAAIITLQSPLGQILQSFQPNLTAHAGGGQANGVLITAMQAFFSVVASAGDSARLTNALPGLEIAVINQTATSMNVFPAVGEQINGLAANTQVPVAGSTVTVFFCGVAGQWWTK